jgi:hypothetical protein
MLKMRELPRAIGGAVLHWHQTAAAGDGGWAHILNTDTRKNRVNTTLAAQATAGAATITVTSGTGFAIGDFINVGIGAAGATGAETLAITAIAGAVLTVSRPDGTTTTLRTHLIGEPVYVVPTAYINLNPLYLMWFGNNDLAASPITSATSHLKERFLAPARLSIARFRCAEIFEDTHTSCVYGGTMTQIFSTATASGGSARQYAALNSTVTIHTPENFPGGVIDLGFIFGGTTGATPPVLTFTVDGVAAGTLSPPSVYTATFNGMPKRFTGLAAGRHTIVAQITTMGTGTVYFDWWGVEAPDPPVVLVPGLLRPYRYDGLWSTWTNARRTTTVTGVHGIGSTSFTVAATTNMLVGQSVTFEETTANAETLEVAVVTDATHFTTTAATTISHAGASSVVYGMQDADIAKENTLIQALCAEFDSKVVFVDVDAVIAKGLAYFWYDGAHLNDGGHSALTLTFFTALRAQLTSRIAAYTSAPTAPLPSALTFVTTPGAAPPAQLAWAVPIALTELFGITSHRKFPDLRRCFEARFIVGVTTAGFAGSSLRVQYSTDAGVTWHYLFRTALYAEDTTHEALLTTTGTKDSGWRPIAVDALITDIPLRIVGVGGNAVAAAALGTVDLYFR